MLKMVLQYEFGQLVFKWFTFTKNFTLKLTQRFLRADFCTKSRFPFSMLQIRQFLSDCQEILYTYLVDKADDIFQTIFIYLC